MTQLVKVLPEEYIEHFSKIKLLSNKFVRSLVLSYHALLLRIQNCIKY